jgi:uncharacterized protein (DUF58 family)
MAFPQSGVSKFRYASIMAAALAWLIIDRGDAAGLMTSSGDALRFLPARSGRVHLRALLAQIERLDAGGTWQADRVIARGAELLKRRGVLLVISDFYDAEEATRRELRRARTRGHDVGMLQVISRPEIEFPYGGNLEVEDLESGARRVITAETTAREYRDGVATFLERCRREAHRDGMDYALMPTDIPPSQALRAHLIRRDQRDRSGTAR